MSEASPESTDELFQNFLEESDELLNIIESKSVSLVSEPDNMSLIHGIFRAVHSLKGNSSFFNFTHVKTFSHSFESFLDLVRTKNIEISPRIVDFILEGTDHLKTIFTRMRRRRGDVEFDEAERDYIDRIDRMVAESGAGFGQERLRAELLRFFGKADAEGELEEDSPAKELRDIIKSCAPELLRDRRSTLEEKGSRWIIGDLDVTREYVGLRKLAQSSLEGEEMDNAYGIFMANVNGLLEKHVEAEMEGEASAIKNLKDEFEIFYQEDIGIDEILAETIKTSLDEYSKNLTEIKPSTGVETDTAQEGPVLSDEPPIFKSVRINEGLLDDFIDKVGELITINELFNSLQRRLEGGDVDGLAQDFKATNQAFSELSGQLQKSLYEIRKAPVERAFSKLPRMARGVAKETGKSIRIVTSGGDTEVDKSLLDRIENILIHCVRNSADHGIESPEERAEKGKSPEGVITVDVDSDGTMIFIKISDDGRGIDTGRVRDLAVERGFITPDAASVMSDDDALNLLLRPGFSTSEKVTETSGRGVGMDVLWSSVHEMNGRMNLTNWPGEGFEVRFALPLAYMTRIKLGLTLRVGKNMFLIPAENIRESFRARREEVSKVEGRGEVVRRWEKIYPLVRLSELFGIEADQKNVWDAICVIVESKNDGACLLVDEMLGQRQIVYKKLALRTMEPSAFEGVSILEGRKLALILSVDGIIKQFQK